MRIAKIILNISLLSILVTGLDARPWNDGQVNSLAVPTSSQSNSPYLRQMAFRQQWGVQPFQIYRIYNKGLSVYREGKSKFRRHVELLSYREKILLLLEIEIREDRAKRKRKLTSGEKQDYHVALLEEVQRIDVQKLGVSLPKIRRVVKKIISALERGDEAGAKQAAANLSEDERAILELERRLYNSRRGRPAFRRPSENDDRVFYYSRYDSKNLRGALDHYNGLIDRQENETAESFGLEYFPEIMRFGRGGRPLPIKLVRSKERGVYSVTYGSIIEDKPAKKAEPERHRPRQVDFEAIYVHLIRYNHLLAEGKFDEAKTFADKYLPHDLVRYDGYDRLLPMVPVQDGGPKIYRLAYSRLPAPRGSKSQYEYPSRGNPLEVTRELEHYNQLIENGRYAAARRYGLAHFPPEQLAFDWKRRPLKGVNRHPDEGLFNAFPGIVKELPRGFRSQSHYEKELEAAIRRRVDKYNDLIADRIYDRAIAFARANLSESLFRLDSDGRPMSVFNFRLAAVQNGLEVKADLTNAILGRVTATHERETTELYELTIEGMKGTIKGTPDHPIFIIGRGWVPIADIKIGEKGKNMRGEPVAILGKKYIKLDKPVKVYNLTVEPGHTYFVSGPGGEGGLLVHNADPCIYEGRCKEIAGVQMPDGSQPPTAPFVPNKKETKATYVTELDKFMGAMADFIEAVGISLIPFYGDMVGIEESLSDLETAIENGDPYLGTASGIGLILGAIGIVTEIVPGADEVADLAITSSRKGLKQGAKELAERASARILENARKRGVRKAWKQEKELIEKTGEGSRRWTKQQKKEILETGKVKGFEGHHINDAKRNPNIADDPNNIKFVKGRKEHIKEHDGNWQNPSNGELIDRKKILEQRGGQP